MSRGELLFSVAKKKPNNSSVSSTILDVSMQLSDVSAQIAMLTHDDSLSMEVKCCELANSFHHSGDESSTLIRQVLPALSDYGTADCIRISSMNRYFPASKILAQENLDERLSPQRVMRNDSIHSPFNDEDNIASHYCYFAAGMAAEMVEDTDPVTIDDEPAWLIHLCNRWDKKTKKSGIPFFTLKNQTRGSSP